MGIIALAVFAMLVYVSYTRNFSGQGMYVLVFTILYPILFISGVSKIFSVFNPSLNANVGRLLMTSFTLVIGNNLAVLVFSIVGVVVCVWIDRYSPPDTQHG